MKVTWTEFKDFLDTRKLSCEQLSETSSRYRLAVQDGATRLECTVEKSDPIGSEQEDYENNYKASSNLKHKQEAVIQAEKNDKTLRCFWAHTVTNASGLARFAIQVPGSKRFIAYGDAEFEQREFLDCISKIEVSDLDRLIAWQIALSINPSAEEPVSDATVIATGDPRFANYPVLDHYDERGFGAPGASTSGTVLPGMGMSFEYGITEAQPIGGYGEIPGGMYLVIECQKETAVANKRCKISIDWAEPHD